MAIVRMTSEEIREKYPLSDSDLQKWGSVKDKDIVYDTDNPRLTDAELKEFRRPGRPKKAAPKKDVHIRFDADVLARLKKTGRGWSTRLNDAVRQLLQDGVL